MAKNKNTEATTALKFQITESYKKARTNIVYSIIKEGCKKIVFTSPFKSEGKTTTAVNVAVALSQQVNTRVLIIDCDLRRPSAHTILDVQPELGLANYLNGECSIEDVKVKTGNEKLDFISYGVIPPNPSELLASKIMEEMIKELEESYDYIIFDTPPVNMVMDAVPLCKLADGVIVVVKHKNTTHPELSKAVEALKRNNSKILGVILNGIPSVQTSKGGYYFRSKNNDTYYA